MKIRVILFTLLGTALALPAVAQDQIYRCGTEYTNRPPKDAKNCRLVEGGNVTVIHGYAPLPARSGASSPDFGTDNAIASAPASAPGAGQQPRVDAAAQRQRDADARLILENELKQAEARQAQLLTAYSGGQPEKIGGEAQNYQKYLDRVAEMKASIDRNQSDIDGIKRELARLAPKQP